MGHLRDASKSMGEEKQYLRLAKFALATLNNPPDLYHQKKLVFPVKHRPMYDCELTCGHLQQWLSFANSALLKHLIATSVVSQRSS